MKKAYETPSVEKITFRYRDQVVAASGTEATGETPTNPSPDDGDDTPVGEITFIINIKTKKFHKPTCTHAKNLSDENKEEVIRQIEIYIASQSEHQSQPCSHH